MTQTIFWSKESVLIKTSVCELIGWCTKNGTITKTGKRIANSTWDDLTPAARNVLTRHGVKQ